MLAPEKIQERIQFFKSELRALPPLDIVRKHIIAGECAIIADSAYFQLRSAVADKYEIHPNEVLIVGSSKLGFSIAPRKMYRHFGDTSDVDVVIVSSYLFDKVWKEVHHYWDQGSYWPRHHDFVKYLFQGWIRPDKLPPANSFPLSNDWWKFFNALSSEDRYSLYKIAGALYRDWDFLEAYQLRGVSACLEQLGAKGVNHEN